MSKNSKRAWFYIGILLGIFSGFVGDILYDSFILWFPQDALAVVGLIALAVLVAAAWIEHSS
jgi:ABC-type dipeptide/oligopeptide/nickel transport system permease subunit